MTTATAIPTGTWTLDPVHSSVSFSVRYLGGTFEGRFRDVGAELTVSGGHATLEGTALVSSVDVGEENLAGHLQTPDFFDAERYGELRFTARDLGLEPGAVRAQGEITIKGVTLPVEVAGTISEPLIDPQGRERIGVELSAEIDRTAFGVSWNNPLPSGEPSLADTVVIGARLFLVRAAD